MKKNITKPLVLIGAGLALMTFFSRNKTEITKEPQEIIAKAVHFRGDNKADDTLYLTASSAEEIAFYKAGIATASAAGKEAIYKDVKNNLGKEPMLRSVDANGMDLPDSDSYKLSILQELSEEMFVKDGVTGQFHSLEKPKGFK